MGETEVYLWDADRGGIPTRRPVLIGDTINGNAAAMIAATPATQQPPSAPAPSAAPTLPAASGPTGAPTPNAPAEKPVLEIMKNESYDRELDSQYQSLGETVKSYIIFGLALTTLLIVQPIASFLLVLVIFGILFVLAAHFSAYFATLKGTKKGSINRTLLGNVTLVIGLLLAFATILLVQIIMTRITPYLNDGASGFENLILPIAIFVLLYSEWIAIRTRTSSLYEIDKNE